MPEVATGIAVHDALVSSSPEEFCSGYDTIYGEYVEIENASMDCAYDNHLASIENAPTEHKLEMWNQFHADLQRKLDQALQSSGGLKAMAQKKYGLEKLDGQHRMGYLLHECLKKYEEKKPSKPFFEWLDEMGEFGVVTLVRDLFAGSATGNVRPSMVNRFMCGVAYLDQQARARYRVNVANSSLSKGTDPFDTTTLQTHFSGRGWAIFVQSPDDVFYSGSHMVGQFHHSSFLEGCPVKCAGEWQVENGTLKVITAKSGHYQPQKQHFIAGLRTLNQANALMHAKVKVYQNKQQVLITAKEFLAKPGPYEIWG